MNVLPNLINCITKQILPFGLKKSQHTDRKNVQDGVPRREKVTHSIYRLIAALLYYTALDVVYNNVLSDHQC